MSGYAEYRIERKLKRIYRLLLELQAQMTTTQNQITRLGDKMSTQIEALTAQVTQTETVMDSAIILLQGLSAQIAETAGDPAAAAALAAELKAKTDILSAAIVANTPPPA